MGLYLQKTNIIRDYLVGVLPGGRGACCTLCALSRMDG